MRFRITKVKRGKFAGQYRFAIIAANNEKIDPRQPYNSKAGVLHAIDLVRRDAADARLEVIE